MSTTIRIIRPASRERPDMLSQRIEELKQRGAQVLYDEIPFDPAWPFTAAAQPRRLAQLSAALLAEDSDIIWCARGGYGVSDLLPDLPWTKLKTAKPKLIVGYSDISALHAAVYGLLGWPCLHAPMPASSLWGQHGERRDIDATWQIVTKVLSGFSLPVKALHPRPQLISGELFGGCLSVLTNLIGTVYFPSSLAGKIVFLEDISENPGRIMRYLNQWLQSGSLDHVQALVLGQFRDCVTGEENTDAHIYQEIARRTKLPVYKSELFGHVCPNLPLMIGAQATISESLLQWELQQPLA